MPSADLSNPYAPPQEGVAPPFAPALSPYRGVDLSEALTALRAHVADPRALAFDRTASGPRIRMAAWVTLAIGAVLGGTAALLSGQNIDAMILVIGGVLGGVIGFIGLVILLVDRTLESRDAASPPEVALRSYVKSIGMGRHGYAWTCLSPTARQQMVVVPDLTPVQTMPGTFTLREPADVKGYGASFARSSGSTMRTMAIKRAVVGRVEGDVASVELDLNFQSWPRWVNIAMFVGLAVFRPAVIVGVIAYLVVRKKCTVHVTKTMLRAQNGVWYVYDGDVFEQRAGG